MATINLTINKRITSVEAGIVLVCDNPTDTIHFTFDAEWAEHTARTARFAWEGKYIDVPFMGQDVTVPEIFETHYVMVGVYSDNIASAPVKINCRYSVKTFGGEQQAPALGVYEQIIEIINASQVGVNVEDAVIRDDGHLILTLSNGEVIDAGEAKGADGLNVTNATVNAESHLIITLSDGTTIDAGICKGDNGADGTPGADGVPGADGAPGADGEDGVSVVGVALNDANHIICTMSDGTTIDAGEIQLPGGGDMQKATYDTTDTGIVDNAEMLGGVLPSGYALAEHGHNVSDLSGILPIAKGGTGADSAANALNNIGAAAASHAHSAGDITSGTLPVSRGGTGASTAAAAITALGITPAAIGALIGGGGIISENVGYTYDTLLTEFPRGLSIMQGGGTAGRFPSKYGLILTLNTGGSSRSLQINIGQDKIAVRGMTSATTNGNWNGVAFTAL